MLEKGDIINLIRDQLITKDYELMSLLWRCTGSKRINLWTDKLVDNRSIKGDLKPEAGMSSATSPAKQVQILRKYEEKDEVDRLTCIPKITSPIVPAGDRILS